MAKEKYRVYLTTKENDPYRSKNFTFTKKVATFYAIGDAANYVEYKNKTQDTFHYFFEKKGNLLDIFETDDDDIQSIRIVLQDKDNYGEILGVLEVKDVNSKSPADTFEKIDRMFGDYHSENEEDWTVDGFVEYLKKFNSSTFSVSYDDDPWDMEL